MHKKCHQRLPAVHQQHLKTQQSLSVVAPRRRQWPLRAAAVPQPLHRRNPLCLQPKRADVILAGTCIVQTILEILGLSSFTVSDRGLRHGLAYELFSR